MKHLIVVPKPVSGCLLFIVIFWPFEWEEPMAPQGLLFFSNLVIKFYSWDVWCQICWVWEPVEKIWITSGCEAYTTTTTTILLLLLMIIDAVYLPVGLVQSLASCDPDVVAAALQRCSRCSLKREGLHAVSKLLTDPRGKVSVLASAVLRSVATQPRLRVQVRGHRVTRGRPAYSEHLCLSNMLPHLVPAT